jgi:hypothetical protein
VGEKCPLLKVKVEAQLIEILSFEKKVPGPLEREAEC